jgi:hypothetical protein
MLLAIVALAMLVARWFDVYWLIAPAFHRDGIYLHWLDATTFVALGGLFVGLAVRTLGERSLVPLHDPSLPLEGEVA